MLSVDDVAVDDRGMLTPETIAAIRLKLPFVDLAKLESNPSENGLQDLITIGAIASFLKMKLAEPAA